MKDKRILVLAGPTASGKTDVARSISRKLPCRMISFDSMQVYRRMPITTQAPGRGTSLVNFVDPREEYSAALFRRDAETLIREAFKKKKTPLLVGGTGLYFRALFNGLFEEDGTGFRDESLRQKFMQEEARYGAGFLHQKLQKTDPAAAAKIHPNDTRRLVRALEVCISSGKPFSALKQNRRGLREEFEPKIFFLDRQRSDLYDRINRRVDAMIRKGLVAEVKKLNRLELSRTAGMALGVREMSSHLQGDISLKEAAELLKKNTRHYAKRQVSWFRHEPGTVFVPVGPKETAQETADKILHLWEKK